MMSQREMFEKSFDRPKNFFELHEEQQWRIDKALGILDWRGEELTEEDKSRYRAHYTLIKEPRMLTSSSLYIFDIVHEECWIVMHPLNGFNDAETFIQFKQDILRAYSTVLSRSDLTAKYDYERQ